MVGPVRDEAIGRLLNGKSAMTESELVLDARAVTGDSSQSNGGAAVVGRHQ